MAADGQATNEQEFEFYSAFTIRRTLADLVFLRDRKLVLLCRLLPHLLLWVLLQRIQLNASRGAETYQQ